MSKLLLPVPRIINYQENNKMVSSLGLIGKSEELAFCVEKIRCYTESYYNLLLVGESGTGKEALARAFHGKNQSKFLVINCALYGDNPEGFLRALFGEHYALGKLGGIIEEASFGTIFLKGLDRLPMSLFPFLKYLLKYRSKDPSSCHKNSLRNCNVIASISTVATEDKREDEGYQKTLLRFVTNIKLPPLRERKEDIRPLVEHFIKKFIKYGVVRRTFSDKVWDRFEGYPWLGNVHELEAETYLLLARAKGSMIAEEDLPHKFFAYAPNLDNGKERFIKSGCRITEEHRAYILHVLNQRSLSNAAKKLGTTTEELEDFRNKHVPRRSYGTPRRR